jgi:hypothetical protein
MKSEEKKGFDVVFFETENRKQPVREFIKKLSKEDQKEVGADIRVVQDNFTSCNCEKKSKNTFERN